AFHHLQLLPPPAATGHGQTPRPSPNHPGRSAPEVPLRGPRIRRHARTLSSANDRTGSGRSLGSKSPKRKVHKEAKNQGCRGCPTHRRGCPTHCVFCDEWALPPRTRSRLAETLLRFQRVDRTEANREAALHAS